MSKRISAKEQEQGNILTAPVVFWDKNIAAITDTGKHSFRYPDKLALEEAPCDPEGFRYAVVFPFEDHSAVKDLSFIINKEKAKFETSGLDIPELRDGRQKRFVGLRDMNDLEDELNRLSEAELEDTPEAAQGADVMEETDKFGNTILLLAVKKGDVVATKRALVSGSNINAQNSIGETPLIMACKSGNTSLVSLLVQKGADKHLFDSSGKIALSYTQNQPRLRAYLTGKVEVPYEDLTYRLNNLKNVTFHRLSADSASSTRGTLTTIGPLLSIKVGWGIGEKTLAVLDRQYPFPTIFALSGSITHRDIDKRLSNALVLNEAYYTGRVFELSDAVGHEIRKTDFGPRKTRFDNENGRESRILYAGHAEKKLMCYVIDHHCFLQLDLEKEELRDLEQISPLPNIYSEKQTSD